MATGRTGMRAAAKPLLSNARVRDALLSASGLSPAPEDDLLPVPRSRSGSHWVHEMLSRLAYVQVDPIVAVERAHHHILFTRNPRYRREDLRRKRVREVVVEGADGDRLEGFFALDAVLQRLDAFPEPPRGLRLLNPFDPVVHDRGTGRSEQVFGFDGAWR